MGDIKMMQAAPAYEKGSLSMTPSYTSMSTPPPYELPVFTISRLHGKHWRVFQGVGKDGPMVYFAAAHHWTKKPSLILHQGPSADGPAVGFARVDCSGGNARIALGDPEHQNTEAITYDSVSETSNWSMKTYEVQPSAGLSDGRPANNYTWTRTKTLSSNFDCRDLVTGQLLATYVSHGVFKPGTFKLAVPPPTEAFLLQILLGFLAAREMEERRSATIAAVSS